MTQSARDEILGRLRARPQDASEVPAADFDVVSSRPWSSEEKIDRLTRNLHAVNGEVHRVASVDLARAIADRLDRGKASTLLLGQDSPFEKPMQSALPDRIQLVSYNRDIEEWKSALFHETDAALTTTRGAIAETGSLILWPTREEPRLMSLVPPLHLAVVSISQLYSTFWEAITKQEWSKGMPTNALLISGPSKTADIEQTLVYGAHGPKELVVFLIE